MGAPPGRTWIPREPGLLGILTTEAVALSVERRPRIQRPSFNPHLTLERGDCRRRRRYGLLDHGRRPQSGSATIVVGPKHNLATVGRFRFRA